MLAAGGAPTMAQTNAERDPLAAEIIVTGSRIVRDGYSAPTPVAVMGQAEIAAQAPANISDFVNQMPAIAGSGTSGTQSGGLSNAAAGINSIGLRGLGAGRTLVLVNGQRSVASSVEGLVDINTIPQDLVERVEVVTGGASAAYGSDAVGGVVNFILKNDYKGLKISADQGLSTYGDARNYRIGVTAGLSLLDDRLHMLFNGEYFHQTPVNSIDRSWNEQGYFQINNPNYTATNGEPQRLVGAGFGPNGYTSGGLITSGPLRGTYFLGDGQTGQLNYGINNPSFGYMIGGDYQTTLAGHLGTNSLVPMDDRLGFFNRTSFDVTPDIQIFAQFSYNRSKSRSYYQQTPSTGVTIGANNAFLQTQYPDIAAQMVANNLSSITIGTSNAGFPVPGSSIKREVYRFVGGASGKLDLFGNDWSWDVYYQKGVTKAREQLINTWNNARMTLAQDAVFGIGGSIVCRSTQTNPTNGCVPIDRLGTAGPSQEALDYIYGDQPLRNQTLKQDVASATVSGGLFDLPAGTVSIAAGGEWRREQINGRVEDEFRSGWLYGNYQVNRGKYDVAEGFVELDVPVFKGFNLNAAGRATHYSVSGWAKTWKVGAQYQMIPDIRLRGNISRDIRAPNLNELFAAGTARTNTVNIPLGANSPVTGDRIQFVQNQMGNMNLKPEVADSWTIGTVLTPTFLPGFMASFDYYNIKIDKAIGTPTAQQTVDLCYGEGIQSYCNNINFNGNSLSTIDLYPVNFAKQSTKGFDIEASYQFELSSIAEKLPGNFRIQGQTTHYIKNVVDDGISFPIDYAGVNAGGTYAVPDWVYRISAFYTLEPVTLNLVARGFSSGVYNNAWVECTSGCPVSTTQYRTINDNSIKGITYFDASASVKFAAGGGDGKLTFIVSNMFNKKPVAIGNGPDGNNVPAYAQTNRGRYDVVGRVFRLSATLEF
ncbi:MAG: TonB-dependent receptor [Sphingobium sp.]|nr:TonB-dependent receptor [Sphingobium sp.]